MCAVEDRGAAEKRLTEPVLEGGAIGRSAPRIAARRLAHGRGRYTDDIVLPRMLHAAFVRSPYAHARILGIDGEEASRQPGVFRVIGGADLAGICEPMVSIAAHRPGHKSAPQPPMARDTAFWQGQPVAAVVAESRAAAEDAADLVVVEYEPLDAVADPSEALAPGAAAIHPGLGDNLAFAHRIETGEVDAAFASAAASVEHEFGFGRHTAVTLEARVTIADYRSSDGTLTVHQSHQSPYQMQEVYAALLGIDDHRVRVICPDVGGGFGLKINVHDDEIATAAISRLLGRPVKYCADRLEAFGADAHSRDHRVRGRIAVSEGGEILAMEVDDLSAIGAFTAFIRFGIAEGMMTITNAGAPYRVPAYRGAMRAAYVNKPIVGMYRGVGVPIACAVTEQLCDMAARAIGMDPVAFRRINYLDPDGLPAASVGGIQLPRISFAQALDRLVEAMGYDALRAEQTALRGRGVHRGIGVATFIEPTAYGPGYYGPSEAPVSTQEGTTVKLEPSGKIRCITSVTDQGQGTLTGIAQIVADQLGVDIGDVDVIAGDSASTPFGGGAWASRGLAMGGEASLAAALALKENVLAIAGPILQADPASLDLRGGAVVDRDGGTARLSLGEVARIGHFRQDTLPADLQPELAATRHHVPNRAHYYVAHGALGCHLELDPETGAVELLGVWVADECGRIVNPLLVDEQLRGGVVQGLGAAFFEECVYDSAGQLLNGTLADYLVPMASEMPDIVTAHIEGLEESTMLGAKGVGEGGTIGATAAAWLAVNDALAPFGAAVSAQPFTPERILAALGAAA